MTWGCVPTFVVGPHPPGHHTDGRTQACTRASLPPAGTQPATGAPDSWGPAPSLQEPASPWSRLRETGVVRRLASCGVGMEEALAQVVGAQILGWGSRDNPSWFQTGAIYPSIYLPAHSSSSLPYPPFIPPPFIHSSTHLSIHSFISPSILSCSHLSTPPPTGPHPSPCIYISVHRPFINPSTYSCIYFFLSVS